MSALDDIRQRVEAATKGPWDMTLSADRKWALVLVNSGTESERRIARSDNDDNAEFIAHARTDIPRLLDALDAVLALHTEDLFRGHLSNGCRICGHDYPCATVRAVNDALEADK